MVSVLVLALILSAAAAPATTISEPKVGFAFDLPQSYQAEHAVSGRGTGIAGWFYVTRGPVPIVEVVSEDARAGVPTTDGGLLSYVKERALEYCQASGSEGSIGADSIVSLGQYRSPHDHRVFEVVVRVKTDHWGGGDDDDSTAVNDSTTPIPLSPSQRSGPSLPRRPSTPSTLGASGRPSWCGCAPIVTSV